MEDPLLVFFVFGDDATMRRRKVATMFSIIVDDLQPLHHVLNHPKLLLLLTFLHGVLQPLVIKVEDLEDGMGILVHHLMEL